MKSEHIEIIKKVLQHEIDYCDENMFDEAGEIDNWNCGRLYLSSQLLNVIKILEQREYKEERERRQFMIGAIQGGGATVPQALTFKDIALNGGGYWKMLSQETQATKVIGYEIYNSATGGTLSSGCCLYQCFIENGKLNIAVTNNASRAAKVDVKVFVE